MLQDQFSAIFVGKYSEYRVVRFVLHNYRLVLNVIVL